MLKELGIERFKFTCVHCGEIWNRDYDVQHVDDGHGHYSAYYSYNGVPAVAPSAREAVNCPRCGASRLHVTLVARRDIPIAPTVGADGDPTWPRVRETDEDRRIRQTAPALPGEPSSEP